MRYLIVNTLTDNDEDVEGIIKELTEKYDVMEVLNTSSMDIKGCIGCNYCWLKTPGICSVKDDYEELLKKYLQVDRVIFIADTSLGFVSSRMKNIIDRVLPLATMYLRFKDGQTRHFPRYKKQIDMGIICRGQGKWQFLNHWMDRVMINISGKSLGVYSVKNRKEIYHGLSNN